MKTLLVLAPLAAATLLLFHACGGSADARQKEIQNLGSDTMLEVAGALAEAYHTAHPEMIISVSGGGSGVGISNLISGDVDIANSSRSLKPKEIEEAKKHGHTPVEHKIGYDGIAIYVHKDNPLPSITMEQLKELFGDGGKLVSWKQLGVDLGADSDKVILGSRQNNSGTYEYFREAVLGGDKGRFKQECNNLNGSKDVVDFCAKTRSAIGYSGIAYATDQVRVVPVMKQAGGAAVLPAVETVLDGSYAISRPLFMFTNGEPVDQIKQYLDWIKSDAGQAVLQRKGYIPLRKV
ncbi:MAG: PstS family phosphate ABC transporter substrate-binding protein [Planctomycetes bacterium]|nr:PstS family phosphate ABC transporter substrate-binding protein [Planctomycetota bacterium]